MTTRITALFLAILLVLAGCSGTTGESTTTADTAASTTTAAKTAPETLTVYALNAGNTSNLGYIPQIKEYAKARQDNVEIELEVFTDVESMEERLKVELIAGEGPDVIFADAFLSLDLSSLARSGAFCDMTDVIAADASFNEENYYTAVMKAGQIGERQYIIPLSFSLPTLISNSAALAEAGIDWDGSNPMDVYAQLLDYIRDAQTPRIGTVCGYIDVPMALMLTGGHAPVNQEAKKVLLGSDECRMLTELGAEMWIQGMTWLQESSRLAAEELPRVPFIYSNWCTSFNELRLYYSAYAAAGLEDDFLMYFAADETGNHALVPEFAAVTAHAQNPDAAWELIRYIINHVQSLNMASGMSMSREVVRNHLNNLVTSTGKNLYGVQVTNLPSDYAAQMSDALDGITSASLYQMSPVAQALKEGVKSYVDGETDFETMLEDVTSRLNLYINE